MTQWRTIMNINIVAIGKIKEKYFTDAINEYAKRLSKFCTFNIIEIPEKTVETNISKKTVDESKQLLLACKGTIVLLDRQGKLTSSPELATLIDNISQTSSTISFIIGGSNGVSDELKQKAHYSISFGKITYPHQLFRVILSEQIYRAFSINSGLPYHK